MARKNAEWRTHLHKHLWQTVEALGKTAWDRKFIEQQIREVACVPPDLEGHTVIISRVDLTRDDLLLGLLGHDPFEAAPAVTRLFPKSCGGFAFTFVIHSC